MDADTIYAVIDLETTGTAVQKGDRIIQFGCALVQHGHIIHTTAQLINPDRPIPGTIQQLTGITPAMLTSAPYFGDVAATFEALLQDTVIVAHNVNFDYPFLSAEFERVGLSPLQQPAIDTVELAQILLPTLASYRLQDLTSYLHIQHDQPHRADSDAASTGQLLVALAKRFQALPSHTQQQLAGFGPQLLRQTGDWLASLVTPRKALPDSLVQVGEFVVRRPQPVAEGAALANYPATPAAKRALLRPAYRVRGGQSKMMDAIYTNATTTQAPLFVEAGTGLGKTLGYLLPYAYVATAERPLVVSTATTVLQEQLADTAVPQLRALLGAPLPAVVVKSPRHYLDLRGFAATLHAQSANRLTRVLEMRLLVWLTQTTTGDLAELHMTNYRAPLFNRIRHTGQVAAPGDPYQAMDFYARLQAQVARSSMIITNHAYLARHADLLGHHRPFLVVDEAQHFADQVAAAHARKLDLGRLRVRLLKLAELIGHGDARDLLAAYADSAVWRYKLQSLAALVDDTLTGVTRMQETVYHHQFPQPAAGSAFVDAALTAEQVTWLTTTLAGPLAKLGRALATIASTVTALLADYTANTTHFLPSDAALFQAVVGIAAGLATQREGLADLRLGDPASVVTVTLPHPLAVTDLAITASVYESGPLVQDLVAGFTAPTFVGATLTVNRDFDFLARQLGYPATGVTPLRLRSPFHYKQQALVLACTDAPSAKDLTPAAYADYLASAILALADNDRATIVLFTSLAQIRLVYHRLAHTRLADRKELLAQGVTGSAAKIAKRFALNHSALLLGAASFFEGVDYPAKALEQVILTRLPFDAPEQPTTQARYAALQAAGADPFAADAVPRATLRLAQSFGRLIRTESDRGAFIVLDPRWLTTPYGRKMQKALPNLKPLAVPLGEMAGYLHDWFDPRKEDVDAASTPK
ncbi:helicase C-terminal domain-containing protein [Lacticaseibacillus nasuensis]|uniref:3'-5' exonuclease DinG n=2 Tax=Lacticaseibacillus TaxID=2759736 RepID=A0A0R1JPQ1_9LACO|nr:helicase C-terminal domain-containing protein [Lacticaseibacillus nasuensis]KRK73293.1 ATP-dependent helicase DinG [Lacticaseibacillus nasuensis JCM 17158]